MTERERIALQDEEESATFKAMRELVDEFPEFFPLGNIFEGDDDA